MERRVFRGGAWRRCPHRGWSAPTGVARWGTRLREREGVAGESRSLPSGGASRPNHRPEFPRIVLSGSPVSEKNSSRKLAGPLDHRYETAPATREGKLQEPGA